MIYFLTALLVIGAVVLAVLGIIKGANIAMDKNRVRRVDAEEKLVRAEIALNKTEGALRRIANTTTDASTVLEAEIALEEAVRYHELEN